MSETSPLSSPDSAAGGGVGARKPICSSHTELCYRCHDPENTHTRNKICLINRLFCRIGDDSFTL